MKNTIILGFREGDLTTSDREQYSSGYKRIVRNTVMSTKKTVEHRTRKTTRGVETALRIPFELPVGDKAIAGYTKALTQDGLRLISASSLKPGTPLNLQFSFGENVCYLNLSGQVALCTQSGKSPSDAYDIQIRFSAIREWEQKILISAIEALKQSSRMQEKSLVKIQVSRDTLALEAAQLPTFAAESHSTERPKEGKTRKGFTPHPDRKEHTSELQSRQYLVCRLLLEK